MECRIIEVSYSSGEFVLLKLAEFPKCGKLDTRLKCSVIGQHVMTVGWSCRARKPPPSDITFYHINTSEIPRGRYSQENWVQRTWDVRLFSQKPYPIYNSAIFSTLFMTWQKIWISYIYDCWGWYSFSINTDFDAFVDGLIDKDENQATLKKKIPNLRLDYKKHALLSTEKAKIDTPFMTKTAEKPYPLRPHVSL